MKRMLLLVCVPILSLLVMADARAAQIIPIPLSGGAAISSNGEWFTGRAAGLGSADNGTAMLWSPNEGFIDLGALPGHSRSFSMGISRDGSVVVGHSIDEVGNEEPFRWTREGGIMSLGGLPGFTSSRAIAVSDDGSVVLGRSSVPFLSSAPWIWTQEAGMEAFELPPGTTSAYLKDVSSDGSVIVGDAYVNGVSHAFLWDRQNGFQLLPPSESFGGVSADGSTLVGVPSPASTSGFFPFRWTREGGLTVLPLPPGAIFGLPYDLTSNGAIIVGNIRTEEGFENDRAFVWDEQHGAQDLRSLLMKEHGFVDGDLPPVLNHAVRISADGRRLTARTYGPLVNGRFPLETTHAIYLDKPLITFDLPGDYNNSGTVEQADLDLVLLNWGADATTPPSGWLNNFPTGLIDQKELDAVLLNWGGTAAARADVAGASGVPEPTTTILLLFGITVAAVWNRAVPLLSAHFWVLLRRLTGINPISVRSAWFTESASEKYSRTSGASMTAPSSSVKC